MAARLNPHHQEMVRQKIQTTQLLKRLQDEGLGKIRLRTGERKSAMFLVNKSLGNPPEDKNLNLSGDLKIEIVKFCADDSTAK